MKVAWSGGKKGVRSRVMTKLGLDSVVRNGQRKEGQRGDLIHGESA